MIAKYTLLTSHEVHIQAKGLDSVYLHFREMAYGKAKVTISCWDTSWTYFWGAMGGNLKEFMSRTNNDYLARKFLNGNTYETDPEAFIKRYKKEVCRMRKNHEINSHEARNLYDENEDIYCQVNDNSLSIYDERLKTVLGQDWYMDLPTKDTADYTWICKILNHVREFFKTCEDDIFAKEKGKV